MVCDYIGAGMAYNKNKWLQSDPLSYFWLKRPERHFNVETEKLLIRFLECIRDEGLEGFYAMARYADYEGILSKGEK